MLVGVVGGEWLFFVLDFFLLEHRGRGRGFQVGGPAPVYFGCFLTVFVFLRLFVIFKTFTMLVMFAPC